MGKSKSLAPASSSPDAVIEIVVALLRVLFSFLSAAILIAATAATFPSKSHAAEKMIAIDVDYLEILRRSPECNDDYAPGCTNCCPKEAKEPPVFREGVINDYAERLLKAVKLAQVRKLSTTHAQVPMGGLVKVNTTLSQNLQDPLGLNVAFTIKDFDSSVDERAVSAFVEAAIPKITWAEGPPPSQRFTLNRSALLAANQSFAVEFPPDFCEVKVDLPRLRARPNLKVLDQFFSGLEPCHHRRLMIVFSPK